jgi:hypothetical protein
MTFGAHAFSPVRVDESLSYFSVDVCEWGHLLSTLHTHEDVMYGMRVLAHASVVVDQKHDRSFPRLSEVVRERALRLVEAPGALHHA